MAVALPSDGSSACHLKDTKEKDYLGRFGRMQGAERAKHLLEGCQGEVQKGIFFFFFKSSNGQLFVLGPSLSFLVTISFYHTVFNIPGSSAKYSHEKQKNKRAAFHQGIFFTFLIFFSCLFCKLGSASVHSVTQKLLLTWRISVIKKKQTCLRHY